MAEAGSDDETLGEQVIRVMGLVVVIDFFVILGFLGFVCPLAPLCHFGLENVRHGGVGVEGRRRVLP